jgi:two-component system cell cycle sensor histidine kinase PleC
VRTGTESYDESFRVQHADGHWVWVRAKGQHYRTLRSEGGRLSGIVLDISDQKSADARVDAAERVLQAAFENAAEAFALWDRDGRLMMCNKRFSEFYGLDQIEIGQKRGDVFARARTPGVSADNADEPLEMFDSCGTSATIELQRAGGRWLLVSERRALDDAKISVATDITALKAHEDELQTSRGLLEVRSRELEAEKERAEEANRSKSEFLANMSHELRTPLNAIIGFSDVMRNEMLGQLPPRYVEYAVDIHRSGQVLLDLINDVLNMARIESGKVELDLAPVDSASLIDEVIRTIEPRAKEAGIELRNSGPAGDQAGAAQPLVERGQVQQRRRLHHRGDAGRGRGRVDLDPRHRHRHRRERHTARDQGLRTRRIRVRGAATQRHGARPCRIERAGGDARRQACHRERARDRDECHLHTAAGRRARGVEK